MRVIAIIQARMGSSRLPGKVLMNLMGKSVLEHVIYRVRQCKEIDDVIIATTTLQKDDVIVNKLNNIGIRSYRGKEEDVLERYYEAAKAYNVTDVVRITSDCPLIDPKVIDEVIRFYKQNSYDIVTNAPGDESERTYPRGLDVEVFSFRSLEEANFNATEEYQREHVTPYIYEHKFKVFKYKNKLDYSSYRWTLDTWEDFELISKIYEAMYNEQQMFYMRDVLEYIDKNPEVVNINKAIVQKSIRGISLKKAVKDDCDLFYKWANEDETRKNSFSSEKIELEDHIRWFYEKLEDSNTEIYVVIKAEKYVGQVRLEKKNDVSYISYSIDKQYRRNGIGTEVLRIIKSLSKENKLIGKVKKTNTASIKAFRKAGYEEVDRVKYLEFIFKDKVF